MDIIIIAAAVAVVAVLVAWTLYKENRQLKRRLGRRTGFVSYDAKSPFPPKTPEQERAEHLDRQLEAVNWQQVTFRRRKVMNGGEYALFRAAMGVTRQPFPTGAFPFFVFSAGVARADHRRRRAGIGESGRGTPRHQFKAV